jgi:hypothetical protein
MTILDVLDHEDFFGPTFPGDTWGAWRTFLKAVFALPMTAEDVATHLLHTERTTPPTAPFREVHCLVGRGAVPTGALPCPPA